MGDGSVMGAGREVFVAGDILTANQVNNLLMDQTVMFFDDAADRTASIPVPLTGMVTYLDDIKELSSWDSTQWVRIGNAKINIQSAEPGTAADGDLWWNSTVGLLRAYFGATSTWVSVGGGGGGGFESSFLLMGA